MNHRSLAYIRGAWHVALALLVSTSAFASPRTIELYSETMSLEPVRLQGAKAYGMYCASCHGPRGLGQAESVIPSLAGQIEPYLVKQLVDFSELDRTAPEMHRLMARPELDRPQSWRNVADYLAKLPPNEHAQVGAGRNLAQGARSYAAYCAKCHGTAGEGSAKGAVPALRGQHYSYLILQLRSFDTGHRENLDRPLADHMKSLSREEMEAIADYLSRNPPASGILPAAREQ